MQLTFLQSADNTHYRRLLELSSATVREYCTRWDCASETFLGIKRGAKPWHAALNRIVMLAGYVADGYDGWIIYLDADAYIADLDFDVRAYLATKSEYAVIAAPSGQQPPLWWDINNGVAAFNFANPKTLELIARWKAQLDAVRAEDLAAEEKWGDVTDDQNIMHNALKEVGGMEAALHADHEVFNWNHRFIRQIIRGVGPLHVRVRQMENRVAAVLGTDRSAADAAVTETHNSDFVHAAYHVLLGREPDAGGLQTVMEVLRTGHGVYQTQMEACLRSGEFENHLPEFLRRFLSTQAIDQLPERLKG